jgi:indolepyruvate ferredoxin oxidoreductase
MERALIGEYREMVRNVAGLVTAETMHTAVEIAAAAELIAGYGPVKDEGVAKFRARVGDLMGSLEPSASKSRITEPA